MTVGINNQSRRPWLLGLISGVLLALLAFAVVTPVSAAGQVSFDDSAKLFTNSADSDAIKQAIAKYPFDVKIVTANTGFNNQDAFDKFVQTKNTDPNQIVLGIYTSSAFNRTSLAFGRSTGISASKADTLSSNGANDFKSGNFRNGAITVLNAVNSEYQAAATARQQQTTANAEAAKKAKEDSDRGTLITIAVVALIAIVLIGGGIFYLLKSSQRIWKQKMDELTATSSKVSDTVVKLSDEIDYLPALPQSDTAKNSFSQGTLQLSEANSSLRQLQGATGFDLLFKWGSYQNKYRDSRARFENIQDTLNSVERTVNQVTGKQLSSGQ